MRNALLLALEPLDDPGNPPWETVGLVPGARTALLPRVFGEALERLRAAVCEHDPAVVICVGQAGDLRLVGGSPR
ncbi:hypothetical protein ACLQ2R_07080 [Streptosporangium sp. DT93]|uniref:pyroglutamyl-peptidase I family protein n=1 Tax=Streptosporangium sp. DT93 TaxID=3393428 RepID=UPI003CE91911